MTFHVLTVQKDREYGTGIVIISVETSDTLNGLFILGKVRGEWVWDLFFKSLFTKEGKVLKWLLKQSQKLLNVDVEEAISKRYVLEVNISGTPKIGLKMKIFKFLVWLMSRLGSPFKVMVEAKEKENETADWQTPPWYDQY